MQNSNAHGTALGGAAGRGRSNSGIYVSGGTGGVGSRRGSGTRQPSTTTTPAFQAPFTDTRSSAPTTNSKQKPTVGGRHFFAPLKKVTRNKEKKTKASVCFIM